VPMSVFAVIPVKTLPKSKTRLSIILNSRERRTLTLTMLEDVVKAVKSSKVYQTVVISADPTVQRIADRLEVMRIPERKQGLNPAVKQATEWCIQNGADSALVLPADIPLIRAGDINQIVKLGSERAIVVLSPSQNGGTNALLQEPPNLISPHFGPRSFMKHLAEASQKRVPARVYQSQRVALDIDSKRDLENFLKIEEQTASRQYLEQIEIDLRLKSLGTS